MPSIADATQTRSGRERWHLAAGVGLLLLGTLFAGLGLAGAVGVTSVRSVGAIGGLAGLAGLLTLVARTPLDDHEAIAAVIGLGIGFAGVSSFWIVTPVELSPGLLAMPIASIFGYLVGVAIVLAAVLAAVSIRPSSGHRSNESPTVGWTRSDEGQHAHQPSADGGREEDDLSFPLDDE